jgi:hypothetical protein
VVKVTFKAGREITLTIMRVDNSEVTNFKQTNVMCLTRQNCDWIAANIVPFSLANDSLD